MRGFKRRIYLITGSGALAYQMATTQAALSTSTIVIINCPGARIGEVPKVDPPAAGCGTGLSIGEASIPVNDAVYVKFVNATGAGINPTLPTLTDPYTVTIF